jgi:hypothetical protein
MFPVVFRRSLDSSDRRLCRRCWQTSRLPDREADLTPGARVQQARDVRAIVSFNYASGDADQNDARLGTFDPLYPLADAFFGFHAAFDRKSFVTPGLHVDAVLRRNMFFRANYFPAFYRAETNDGVYNTFNQIVRRPEPQSKGRGTYLRFNAGQFFDDPQSPPRDNMHGVMILTQFTF